MPVSQLLSSFNAGELSPYMDARSDVEKYTSGCRTLENFITLPYGGVQRRPGTEYLGRAKYGDRRCRLIGFNFSTTTRFVLEMGDLYLRFWSNGVQVMDPGNPTLPLEVASPYTDGQVRQVQYIQINDVMYFCHPIHPPQKLVRKADDNWEFGAVAWDWPPLLDENIENTTINPSYGGQFDFPCESGGRIFCDRLSAELGGMGGCGADRRIFASQQHDLSLWHVGVHNLWSMGGCGGGGAKDRLCGLGGHSNLQEWE
jgi:hypothetical protein